MKKAVKLLKKLLIEFFALGRHYSWRYATYSLVWWLCFYIRTRYTWNISQWALNKKTAWLDSYFKKDLNINEYNIADKKILTVDEFHIWVFWGQGEENMPPLVKACYRQLNKYNNNIYLITYDNARDYIDLPEIIYQKVRNGKLSWAHFSDIVRTSLLAKYGGLWLDATVWVSGKLPIEKILEKPFWSANSKSEHRDSDVCFWTSGEWNWSTWCMSVNHNNSILFSFISSIMQKTACLQKVWPDYVFQDYLIYYACRHSKTVCHDMESMIIANPKRNELAEQMGLIYNEETYKKLISSEFVFKLSFKTKLKEDIYGMPTFYGKLIFGDL